MLLTFGQLQPGLKRAQLLMEVMSRAKAKNLKDLFIEMRSV